MKIDFDTTTATKQVIGSITFLDYPNGGYTVQIDKKYFAIVYSNGDSVYFRTHDNEYYVSRIVTEDGLTFTYDKSNLRSITLKQDRKLVEWFQHEIAN